MKGWTKAEIKKNYPSFVKRYGQAKAGYGKAKVIVKKGHKHGQTALRGINKVFDWIEGPQKPKKPVSKQSHSINFYVDWEKI